MTEQEQTDLNMALAKALETWWYLPDVRHTVEAPKYCTDPVASHELVLEMVGRGFHYGLTTEHHRPIAKRWWAGFMLGSGKRGSRWSGRAPFDFEAIAQAALQALTAQNQAE